uniref:PPUP8975 n=1 Tax=Poeciliopsis prolifica TaxID=188132 RepID=A0A0S7EUK3_9TELE
MSNNYQKLCEFCWKPLSSQSLEGKCRSIEFKLIEVQSEVSTINEVRGAKTKTGVSPHIIFKSNISTVTEQEILKDFMLHLADKLHGDTDFISQHELAAAHTDKGTKRWLSYHSVTVMDKHTDLTRTL